MKFDPDRPAFSVCDEHGVVTRPYRQHDKRRGKVSWRCRLCSLNNTKQWQDTKGREWKRRYSARYHAKNRVRINLRHRQYAAKNRVRIAAAWRRNKQLRTGRYVPAHGSRFYCRIEQKFTDCYVYLAGGRERRRCKPCKRSYDNARRGRARLKEAA